MGTSEAELLRCCPTQRAEDLVDAWGYYRVHKQEVELQIRDNQEVQVARCYSNENLLRAVEELRRLGHGVLTIQESGQAGRAMTDEAVLEFANAAGRVLLTPNRRQFIQRSDIS